MYVRCTYHIALRFAISTQCPTASLQRTFSSALATEISCKGFMRMHAGTTAAADDEGLSNDEEPTPGR